MRQINKIAWNTMTANAPKQVAFLADDNDECYLDGDVLFLIQKPCNNVVAYALIRNIRNVVSLKNFLRYFAETDNILRIEEFKKGHYNYLKRTLKAPAMFYTIENGKTVYYLNFNYIKGEDIVWKLK